MDAARLAKRRYRDRVLKRRACWCLDDSMLGEVVVREPLPRECCCCSDCCSFRSERVPWRLRRRPLPLRSDHLFCRRNHECYVVDSRSQNCFQKHWDQRVAFFVVLCARNSRHNCSSVVESIRTIPMVLRQVRVQRTDYHHCRRLFQYRCCCCDDRIYTCTL